MNLMNLVIMVSFIFTLNLNAQDSKNGNNFDAHIVQMQEHQQQEWKNYIDEGIKKALKFADEKLHIYADYDFKWTEGFYPSVLDRPGLAAPCKDQQGQTTACFHKSMVHAMKSEFIHDGETCEASFLVFHQVMNTSRSLSGAFSYKPRPVRFFHLPSSKPLGGISNDGSTLEPRKARSLVQSIQRDLTWPL